MCYLYVDAHANLTDSIIGYGGSGGEMADSCLVPPQPFDFRKPDEWPRWLRRFEQYRVASGLSTEDEEKQVNTVILPG